MQWQGRQTTARAALTILANRKLTGRSGIFGWCCCCVLRAGFMRCHHHGRLAIRGLGLREQSLCWHRQHEQALQQGEEEGKATHVPSLARCPAERRNALFQPWRCSRQRSNAATSQGRAGAQKCQRASAVLPALAMPRGRFQTIRAAPIPTIKGA